MPLPLPFVPGPALLAVVMGTQPDEQPATVLRREDAILPCPACGRDAVWRYHERRPVEIFCCTDVLVGLEAEPLPVKAYEPGLDYRPVRDGAA